MAHEPRQSGSTESRDGGGCLSVPRGARSTGLGRAVMESGTRHTDSYPLPPCHDKCAGLSQDAEGLDARQDLRGALCGDRGERRECLERAWGARRERRERVESVRSA